MVFGAGYDTLYWLLWKQGNLPLLFTEVDFPDVTSRKCHYIKYVGIEFSLIRTPQAMECVLISGIVLIPRTAAS